MFWIFVIFLVKLKWSIAKHSKQINKFVSVQGYLFFTKLMVRIEYMTEKLIDWSTSDLAFDTNSHSSLALPETVFILFFRRGSIAIFTLLTIRDGFTEVANVAKFAQITFFAVVFAWCLAFSGHLKVFTFSTIRVAVECCNPKVKNIENDLVSGFISKQFVLEQNPDVQKILYFL